MDEKSTYYLANNLRNFGGLMIRYIPRGVCSRQIEIEIENNTIKSVNFIGGCKGNLQGIAKLCENRNVLEVINLLEGINCRGNTSCPDQLAKALKKYLEEKQ